MKTDDVSRVSPSRWFTHSSCVRALLEEEDEVLGIRSCVRALMEEEFEVLGIWSCVRVFVEEEVEVL